MWETCVLSLGWEDPLEKGKATHSSILAGRIGLCRPGVTKSWTRLSNFYLMSSNRKPQISIPFRKRCEVIVSRKEIGSQIINHTGTLTSALQNVSPGNLLETSQSTEQTSKTACTCSGIKSKRILYKRNVKYWNILFSSKMHLLACLFETNFYCLSSAID